MRLTGVIFDLDGTLVDTLPVCFVAFRHAFERLDGPVYSDDDIRALFGPSEEGMMQRAMPDRWHDAVAAYLEEYETSLRMCPRPFPGIDRVLKLLGDRRVPVAIVTGKGPISTAMSVKHFRFEGVFDEVESGSPSGIVKAEAIARIVAKWALAPRETAYVGDADGDMRAAREAGVLAVGAAWAPTAHAAELRACEPDQLFPTVESFSEWLAATT